MTKLRKSIIKCNLTCAQDIDNCGKFRLNLKECFITSLERLKVFDVLRNVLPYFIIQKENTRKPLITG